jgi:transposase
MDVQDRHAPSRSRSSHGKEIFPLDTNWKKDLDGRQVIEVCSGRKLEEVTALLERLSDPDAVEAVSMDMSASFRPAVHLCLRDPHKSSSITSM